MILAICVLAVVVMYLFIVEEGAEAPIILLICDQTVVIDKLLYALQQLSR
jgi:hypothetical protein